MPGLYYKLHGVHRPVKMKKATIKRRKRVVPAHLQGRYSEPSSSTTISRQHLAAASKDQDRLTSKPSSISSQPRVQLVKPSVILPLSNINSNRSVSKQEGPTDTTSHDRSHPPPVDFTGYSFDSAERTSDHHLSLGSESSVNGSGSDLTSTHRTTSMARDYQRISPSAAPEVPRTSFTMTTTSATTSSNEILAISQPANAQYAGNTSSLSPPPINRISTAITATVTTTAERLPSITSILNAECHEPLQALSPSLYSSSSPPLVDCRMDFIPRAATNRTSNFHGAQTSPYVPASRILPFPTPATLNHPPPHPSSSSWHTWPNQRPRSHHSSPLQNSSASTTNNAVVNPTPLQDQVSGTLCHHCPDHGSHDYNNEDSHLEAQIQTQALVAPAATKTKSKHTKRGTSTEKKEKEKNLDQNDSPLRKILLTEKKVELEREAHLMRKSLADKEKELADVSESLVAYLGSSVSSTFSDDDGDVDDDDDDHVSLSSSSLAASASASSSASA